MSQFEFSRIWEDSGPSALSVWIAADALEAALQKPPLNTVTIPFRPERAAEHP
jgi:hypothetical protein